jgi:hypothetical protein
MLSANGRITEITMGGRFFYGKNQTDAGGLS